MVDNCYGEFVETIEPSDVGADLIVGYARSKNPGRGLRRARLVLQGEQILIETALTADFSGTRKEVGASLGVMQSFIRDFSSLRRLYAVH